MPQKRKPVGSADSTGGQFTRCSSPDQPSNGGLTLASQQSGSIKPAHSASYAGTTPAVQKLVTLIRKGNDPPVDLPGANHTPDDEAWMRVGDKILQDDDFSREYLSACIGEVNDHCFQDSEWVTDNADPRDAEAGIEEAADQEFTAWEAAVSRDEPMHNRIQERMKAAWTDDLRETYNDNLHEAAGLANESLNDPAYWR